MVRQEILVGLATTVSMMFSGCMTGCVAPKNGRSLFGDFAWKSSNQAEIRWQEQRDAEAAMLTEQRAAWKSMTEYFHTAIGEVVLALGGPDAYGVWTGKVDPAILALKNQMAEDKADTDRRAAENEAKTDAAAGMMGNIAKGGLMATILSGGVFGGVKIGRRKNGNGATPTTG